MEASIGGAIALVAILTTMGGGVMKVMDFIRKAFDKKMTWSPVVVETLALVVSVAVALGFRYDVTAQALALIPAFAEGSTRLVGIPGQVLTGFAVWFVSTYLHEKRDDIRTSAGKLPYNQSRSYDPSAKKML